MNKKGTLTLYIIMIFVSIIIILITAFAAPFGALMSAELYAAGEGILLDMNESINDINDTSVRDSIRGQTNAALNAGQTNIEVSTNIFQYGWILILVVLAAIIFLSARSLSEFRGGFN